MMFSMIGRVLRQGSATLCRVSSLHPSAPTTTSFSSLASHISKTVANKTTNFTGCCSLSTSQRFNSSYDPYTDTEAPSPYKDKPMYRIGYKNKHYTGGLLPRPKGDEWQKPLSLPKGTKPDKWTKKKALFGQNDYIDILGDGNVEPWRLMKGPAWLKGFQGNEIQRLIRRLKFEGRYLRAEKPDTYHKVYKRIWYLYKKYNHRRVRSNYWGRGAAQKCRIFRYGENK